MRKIKLQPRTLERAELAKEFLSKQRSRREVADFLKITKEAARNILENHPKIRCVKKATPGAREESFYIWWEEETVPAPTPRQPSPWDVLKR